jgi:hypothetical protein
MPISIVDRRPGAGAGFVWQHQRRLEVALDIVWEPVSFRIEFEAMPIQPA